MNQTSIAPLADSAPKLELISQVRSVIEQVLGQEDIANDSDLIETGTLDSLALVSLIMELESNFDLTVSYDELEIDAFRSVHSIATFILSSKRN